MSAGKKENEKKNVDQFTSKIVKYSFLEFKNVFKPIKTIYILNPEVLNNFFRICEKCDFS